MLKDRREALFKMPDEYTILEEMKGQTLVGKKYEPLFDYFVHYKSDVPGQGAFRVVRWAQSCICVSLFFSNIP